MTGDQPVTLDPDEGPSKLVAGAARRIGPLDWLMLVLALLSVGLLSYETWGDVDAFTRRWISTGDYVICGIFALEFLWRWRAAGWDRGFVGRNWYEVLGMIPIQHPAIRGFRLFRVIRIVILLSRFGAAADRAFGEEFTYRLINRFRNTLVQAISGAVTVAVLDEVSVVLSKGHYTRNIANAIRQNQDNITATIFDKLREDPKTSRFTHLPMYDSVVRATVGTALRMLLEVLEDARTDQLVADILQENLLQIREAVRLNEETRQQQRATIR